MRRPYFFLLGGQDLEMQEIRKLLESTGLKEGKDFIDKNLKWGAKLSEYTKNFHHTRINVCIELTEDSIPPKRYLRIDHHNELTTNEASIEQIAKLLNMQLNRWQKLVAANDKNFIPGMISIGASKEEIQEVRLADRKAQGATPLDELLAEQSISQNLQCLNPSSQAFVIKSLTSKFSTITDRLYTTYQTLLVYSETEFTYYGTDFHKFDNLLTDVPHYNGRGFMGVGAGVLTQDELKRIVNCMFGVMKQ
jgi:hypothetical protein